jgi:hypothetical protein
LANKKGEEVAGSNLHATAAVPNFQSLRLYMLGSHHGAAGRLAAAALCQAVASVQLADTVLVDESLTSGNAYWEASKVRYLTSWEPGIDVFGLR